MIVKIGFDIEVPNDQVEFVNGFVSMVTGIVGDDMKAVDYVGGVYQCPNCGELKEESEFYLRETSSGRLIRASNKCCKSCRKMGANSSYLGGF